MRASSITAFVAAACVAASPGLTLAQAMAGGRAGAYGQAGAEANGMADLLRASEVSPEAARKMNCQELAAGINRHTAALSANSAEQMALYDKRRGQYEALTGSVGAGMMAMGALSQLGPLGGMAASALAKANGLNATRRANEMKGAMAELQSSLGPMQVAAATMSVLSTEWNGRACEGSIDDMSAPPEPPAGSYAAGAQACASMPETARKACERARKR